MNNAPSNQNHAPELFFFRETDNLFSFQITSHYESHQRKSHEVYSPMPLELTIICT